MILKHIGSKKRLFVGEIKNYRQHYKFINNNPDFRQVEIYNEGRLIYRTYPMLTEEAKKLDNLIFNNSDSLFSIMHLTI